MSNRELITFDWALKRLFRSKANFDILEGFLSELLMEDIKILEILESESNQNTAGDKYNRVDLKVLNQSGEIVLVEIQYERQMDYLQRILYGVSKAITEHIDLGNPYLQVARVISISILYFDLGQGEDYVYKGTTQFKGLHKNDVLLLSDSQQKLYQKENISEIYPEYYLLKVNQFNDIARDNLDEWIYFLKNGTIKDEFKAKGIMKAKTAMDILRLSDAERREYERYKENLHYQASMYESHYLQGEQIGLERGEKLTKFKSAKNLLDILDDQTISQKIGLSIKEVETLRKTGKIPQED